MTRKYSIQQNDSCLGTTRRYYKALNKDITNDDNNNHNKINNNNQSLFNNSNEQC